MKLSKFGWSSTTPTEKLDLPPSLGHFHFEPEIPPPSTIPGEWNGQLASRRRQFEQRTAPPRRSNAVWELSHHLQSGVRPALSEVRDAGPWEAVEHVLRELAELARDSGQAGAMLLATRVEDVLGAADRFREAHAHAHSHPHTHDHHHKHGHDHDHAHGHVHDHGGGGVVVDLDEAAHGLNAALSYLVQVLSGNGSEVVKEFVDNAALLAASPIGWVKDSGAPHGTLDFAVSMGVAPLMLPLAVVAMVAGIHEMHGAVHQDKALKGRARELERQARTLCRTAAESPSARNLLDAMAKSTDQQVKDLGLAIRQNLHGGMVGAFSFSSGVAIGAKAAVDLVLKPWHYATDGLGLGGGISTATGVSGIVNTFALGPVAAASAVGLGAHMVRKTDRKRAAVHADKVRTEAWLAGNGPPDSPRLQRYERFIQPKLQQQDDFYRSYSRWNRGFLAGSSVYATSVGAKVAVALAVAGGAAAIAHPATLATLVAAGAIGGIVMGVDSWQFLFGHERQSRYENYFTDDDPELDRHFLAGLDLAALLDPGRLDPLAGLETRAAFFDQIQRRDDRRQDFLASVARDVSKDFGSRLWTGDSPAIAAKRDPKPRKRDLLRATLRQRGEKIVGGVQAAAARPWGQAAARDAWNQAQADLTEDDLLDWLACPDLRPRQVGLMSDMLQPQIDYHQEKTAAKLALYQDLRREPAKTGALRTEAEVAADQARELAIADTLLRMDAELEHDIGLLNQMRELHDRLEAQKRRASRGEGVCEEALGNDIAMFVQLQQGRPWQPPAPGHERPPLRERQRELAHFLLTDASKRYRDLRGKLVQTEMEATRLRDSVLDSVRGGVRDGVRDGDPPHAEPPPR